MTDAAAQIREHILGCAMGLFASRGYRDVSMREVARASEVALDELLALYAGRDELAAAFYGRVADEVAALYCERDDEHQPPQLRMFELLYAQIDVLEPYRDLVQTTYKALLNPLGPLYRLTADVRRRIFGLAEDIIIDARRRCGGVALGRTWESGLFLTANGWCLAVFAELDDPDEWMATVDRAAGWLLSNVAVTAVREAGDESRRGARVAARSGPR